MMIKIYENKCDFCGVCVAVCPPDCIEVREASIKIDDNICGLCKYHYPNKKTCKH